LAKSPGGTYGRYQLSRRFLIWTLGNGLPFQNAGNRGIVESVTSNPSRVAIFQFVPGTGTESAFLVCAGTPGLLAILLPGVCLDGFSNFGGFSRCACRKARHQLGEYSAAWDFDNCAQSCRTSLKSNPSRRECDAIRKEIVLPRTCT
jgi:hypothetical protein